MVDAGRRDMRTIGEGRAQRHAVTMLGGSRAPRVLAIFVGGAVAVVAAGPAGAVTAGDPRDQPYLSTIVNQALETERTNVDIPWSNPETGHRGVLVIERTFYRDPQSPCRDYRWTLERGSRPPATITGTGCRIGPALWRLDEREAASPLRMPDRSAPLPPPASPPPVVTGTPDPAGPDPGVAPGTTTGTTPAPSPAPPPARATTEPAPPKRTAKAEPAPKRSAPASKPQTAAGAGNAAPPKPPALPGYTLPSKTTM
jgi:surface antigen